MKSILRKVNREQLQFPTKSFNKNTINMYKQNTKSPQRREIRARSGASDKEHF